MIIKKITDEKLFLDRVVDVDITDVGCGDLDVEIELTENVKM